MSAGRFGLLLLVAVSARSQPSNCVDVAGAATQPQFFDEPNFIVAGVTDNTYRGGHGSDTILRSSEALANATASLGNGSQRQSQDPLQLVQEMQRAAEANPTEPNIFVWATELLAHRAPDAAAEVFTNGVRRYPQSVRILLGLASARYAAGSYARAADCFFAAADLAPNDPTPYLFLGKVEARGILESVGYLERMARFAERQPQNALANYYYAAAIWNRRRGPEDVQASANARHLLDKAIALDPRLGLAHLELGIIYAEEHEYSKAIQAYRRAINATPQLEEVHYRLAQAYRLTGEQAEADQELAEYKRLSKESAQEAERERRAVQQFVIALRQSPPAKTNSR